MNVHIIKTLGYLDKISDIYFFLDHASSAVSSPLHKENYVEKWLDGASTMLENDFLASIGILPENMNSFKKTAISSIESSLKDKMHNSNLTVLNMSHVMMCTAIEQYFEHVLFTIFTAKPQILLSFSKDKNISLEKFLEQSSYAAVLDEYIQKTVDKIIRQGVKEAISAFSKFGITVESIFSWSLFTEDVQDKFCDWDRKKLVEIFNERNAIVHDSEIKIENLNELLVRKEFFEKVILNLSFLTWKKFYNYGIILDIHEKIRENIRISGGDASAYPPPPK